MKLVIGLGNPGRTYAGNRHNIGFICLNRFARKQGIRFEKKQAKARTGSGGVDGIQVLLARPQTFMNLSGQAVGRLVKKFNVSPGDLIVIHDDLDLSPGKVRIRRGGSSGGHKGVASIIGELGDPDFIRIRVGIGRPPMAEEAGEVSEADIIDFVLGDFTPEVRKTINRAVAGVGEALQYLLVEGLEAAMNRYN